MMQHNTLASTASQAALGGQTSPATNVFVFPLRLRASAWNFFRLCVELHFVFACQTILDN